MQVRGRVADELGVGVDDRSDVVGDGSNLFVGGEGDLGIGLGLSLGLPLLQSFLSKVPGTIVIFVGVVDGSRPCVIGSSPEVRGRVADDLGVGFGLGRRGGDQTENY